ncbi:ATP-binding protein [Sulfitobacter sp. S190]|uniref:ATP-binding protein n=1 Tax=Sulfitobacter sp. S190 TaxID=2867022 RepID=UPI0021A4200D|nr:ATP-binding protein [Sulfitobacter sp. S190]UWR22316.1 response regulator [Sulfitobacter sp. S190]
MNDIANKLIAERRGRLAAERLLEQKQAELFAANRKLNHHARQLSHEITETRAEVEVIRGENKRVKSDLNAAQEKIAVVERRLWHSIRTIKDGFAFFDASNRLIMANEAYLSVFEGIDIVETGVEYATILEVLTDEGIVDLDGTNAADWRTMMRARFDLDTPPPIELKLWNGRSVKLVDQRGPGGDVVSLGLDITETVRYQAQLADAREAAETANRAKSAFLANMSHEIRTPMNGVVGMADMLGDTGLTDDQKLYVDTIKSSGEALLVIINDVLDYSKIEAGHLDLHIAPFDLERAFQDVTLLLQPMAQAKGLSLVLEYDLFLPSMLEGDAGRLRQVLTNLVGNAIKFTAAGHVLVRVTGVPDDVTRRLALHVVVEDTGIGIAEDEIDHIFGEFTQVENERNRQFDGTGLGLSITKRLVEMMGGDIWVDAVEGQGSSFGFRLTLDVTEGSVAPLIVPKPLRRIILAGPDEVAMAALARQLRQGGPQVDVHTSVAGLLNSVTAADCVIIDENILADTAPIWSDLHQTSPETACVLLCKSPDQMRADADVPDDSICIAKPWSRQSLMTALGTAADRIKPPADTARRMRVLAAEDNKTNRLVLEKMLGKLNIDLKFACDGTEAVELWRSFAPDLVFMDISMPRMDGKAATAAIRAAEQGTGEHVPIVAMTAHALEGDKDQLLAAGLDQYLAKPLRRTALEEQLRKALPPHAAALTQTDSHE